MFVKLSIPTLIALIITCFLIYKYVYKFYVNVKLYPRGPMPLPIVGNCLMLGKHLDRHLSFFFKDLAHKYGDTYTFWLATKPVVLINGISLAKDAFNRNEFCDRFEPSLQLKLNECLIGGHNSWVLMNMSDEYKQLRTISVHSIRKFLSNDKLSKLTHEIILETVGVMKRRESDDAFEPFQYIDSVFIRLFIGSIFGQKVSFDSDLIEQISLFYEYFQRNFVRLTVSEIIPLYNYLVNSETDNLKCINSTFKSFSDWYKNLIKQTLNADSSGNFGESLISSVNALRNTDTNESNEYFNDSNLTGTLISLFLAASDTTHYTFRWILLLMAYYPEMQQKMRNEINANIGNNKIAELSDMAKCVYVNAFICETLRYRNPSPLALPHLTSSDILLGDISIPKQTTILLNQLSILNDSRYWKNPDTFSPERFIDTEQNVLASKMSSFIPFGTGKRMCVGEKFAMNTLFLVLASLLQATDGKKFLLQNKQSVNLEPKKFSFFLEPNIYQVRLINE